MRKGNAWKHRNDRSWRTPRTVEKRDLLRYTSLSPAEVARRSAINLYQSLRRDCNMSATERWQALRQEGDEGRFVL
jgi:hypothetical protein